MDRPILLAAALVLAVAACSPQPPEPEGRELQAQAAADPAGDAAPPAAAPGDDQQPAGAEMDSCDPTAVQALVGNQATEDLNERARIAAGADTVRTLRPDQVVTMEYRAGRLNIDVDDAGIITGFRCG